MSDNQPLKKRRHRAANGEGSFYVRNGILYGSFQITRFGKTTRTIIRGASKEEIRKQAQRLQNTYTTARPHFTAGRTHVTEFIDYWLETIKRHSVTPKTFQKYESTMRLYIFPYLGTKTLSALSTPMLQAFFNMWSDGELLGSKNKPLSSSTIRIMRTYLIEALEHSIDLGILSRNPAKRTKPPTLEKEEIKVLSAEQLSELLRVMKAEATKKLSSYSFMPSYASYIAVLIAASTGMRLGEVFGLCWDCIDFGTNTIEVKRTINSGLKGESLKSTTKTKTSRRNIPMSQNLVSELREFKKIQQRYIDFLGDKWHAPAPTPVITGSFGSRLNTSNFKSRYFKPALQKAGLPCIRYHDLRHTHATLLMKAKVNPKIVQERLGHSTITQTLDTYSHLVPDIQKEAVNALEKLGL